MSEENNQQNTDQQEQQSAPQSSPKVNAIAIFSYLGIFCLIPLLVAKDDEFAQYHAKQGLVVFLTWVCVTFLGVIPILGWLLIIVSWPVIVGLSVFGIVNVLRGKRKEIPLLGKYGKSFKI